MSMTRRVVLAAGVATAALARAASARAVSGENNPAKNAPAAGKVLAVILDDKADLIGRNAVAAFSRRLALQRGVTVTIHTRREIDRLGASSALEVDWVVCAGLARASGQAHAELVALGLAAPEQPESFALDIRASQGWVAERFPRAEVQALVCGHDDRGVLYGLGKLLRVADFATGGAVPAISVLEIPATKERGAYFASHFNNYYERAPIEEVELYIEDMAFWGFNNIWTWFDMNWYPESFDRDPESRGSQMVDRIRRINKKATGLGITTGLIGIANEGFSHQPPRGLLADIGDRRGGFYPHSSICASKPGGLELILKNRREVMQRIGPIDIFIVWPFDQGGCGCPQCHPWATKFLSIAPDIARELRRVSPKAKFYLSTWLFKDDEMNQVQALAQSGPAWLDGILCEASRAATFDPPQRYARLVFPEISMSGSLFTGYGASGANPMPHKFVDEARVAAKFGFGAALYSEGIFEDINKVIWASVLWNPMRKAPEVIDEYVAFYFGRQQQTEWRALILGLESTWPPETLDKTKPETVHALLAAAERLGRLAPTNSPSQTRWRYLRDRAAMDSAMVRIGSDTALLRDTFALLEEIGYTQDLLAFRTRLNRFLDRVRQRVVAIEALFATHWAYLESAHLERSTGFVITPPAFMGQRDWDTLLDVLDRAAAEVEGETMRTKIIFGMKKWFWHNNISLNVLFL